MALLLTSLCRYLIPVLLALLLSPVAQAADVTTGENPDTGLRYWQWHAGDLLLKLTQRLPDQTRAFFLARGFNAKQSDMIATSCVFQSMMKNTGKNSVIELDLSKWKVTHGGQQQTLHTREVWTKLWQQQKADMAAQIAFEWSLLPTRQTYLGDDYNWGMSSYGLKPGSRFDLYFSWQRNGINHHGRINGIECPADIHPEPPQ